MTVLEGWPDSNPPCARSEGYSLDPLAHNIRTDMETGTPRVRLRSKAKQDRIQVQWTMETPRFKLWRDWYRSATGANYGQRWFQISLQRGEDPNGAVTTESARFVGPWRMVMESGTVVTVSGVLEVRD